MPVGSWLSQDWQLSSTPEFSVQLCPQVEKSIKVFLKYLVMSPVLLLWLFLVFQTLPPPPDFLFKWSKMKITTGHGSDLT